MVQHIVQSDMVNENFEPSERQEKLLSVLTEGRDSGEPWGYATVKRFTEEADLRKQYVSRELEGLLGAGWVSKPYRGLYRFVEDPREDNPDRS
ncbi:MarR family transcriptional regulator [Natrinema soli]|uniref:MarR family transcriptional regulator n=1 Tax=Natrinema soli TaxID=1930624 RepID=A0ABD5SHG9_9EURY|nr:MarR family transcriptional regulator [Natrinema soli]